MDLSTTYMGFELSHPLIPGASPLSAHLDTVRRLEDAGAPAIVLHSLFEEQILREELAITRSLERSKESYAEALGYLPDIEEFSLGPDEYLEHVRQVKQAVAVPVIGSLNGTTPSGWLRFAKLIEQAGADGLELNLYEVAADLCEPGRQVEFRAVDVVHTVKASISIPVAVKISPFYSSMANFARQLDTAGASGLVLFNRFYQPDIDPEALEVKRVVRLSDSSELLLRLRWLALLFGKLNAQLAVSGGVHDSLDAIKAVMAGASVVQIVSALLRHGPDHLSVVREGMTRWMEEHEYTSLKQMQGSMSLVRSPDPRAYERANYVRILQTWEGETL